MSLVYVTPQVTITLQNTDGFGNFYDTPNPESGATALGSINVDYSTGLTSAAYASDNKIQQITYKEEGVDKTIYAVPNSTYQFKAFDPATLPTSVTEPSTIIASFEKEKITLTLQITTDEDSGAAFYNGSTSVGATVEQTVSYGTNVSWSGA